MATVHQTAATATDCPTCSTPIDYLETPSAADLDALVGWYGEQAPVRLTPCGCVVAIGDIEAMRRTCHLCGGAFTDPDAFVGHWRADHNW